MRTWNTTYRSMMIVSSFAATYSRNLSLRSQSMLRTTRSWSTTAIARHVELATQFYSARLSRPAPSSSPRDTKALFARMVAICTRSFCQQTASISKSIQWVQTTRTPKPADARRLTVKSRETRTLVKNSAIRSILTQQRRRWRVAFAKNLNRTSVGSTCSDAVAKHTFATLTAFLSSKPRSSTMRTAPCN